MITLNRKSKEIGHFEAKIGKKILTLNGKSKGIVTSKPLLSQIRKNGYFKYEIKGNHYFKFTVKPKLAKNITSNRKLLFYIYFEA